MKKGLSLLGIIAGAFLLASLMWVSHPGLLSALNYGAFRIPVSANALPAQNLTFVGAEAGHVNQTATAQVIHSGSGILYDIEISTGAATIYAVCSDSATPNTSLTSTANPLLVPPVFANTASWDSVKSKGFTPTEFNNGLNCWTSTNQARLVVKYRPSNL